jgi:micrococcal nuclease
MGGPTEPAVVTTACVVARIVDGDTIECPAGTRVRFIGMDTPEMRQPPFGAAARDALAQRIPVGTEVELEPDVERRDRYGRVLAYVWASDTLVNWWLVRSGWAVLATYPPNVRYVDSFTVAQRQARTEGVGLWAVDGFACLPADHRRGRC